MAAPTLVDMMSRTAPMAKKKWVKKSEFKPGGEKGKLHRELGIPEGEKIPASRLEAAAHSRDGEVRRDAIRAQTMKGWKHGGKSKMYDKSRAKMEA
jgi:hypothetical protein